MRTIDAFRQVVAAHDITTVVAADMTGYWHETCRQYGYIPGPLTTGGATRWQSVKNGLEHLGSIPSDTIVLVHDAARPLVSRQIIEDVVNAIENGAHGAVPVVEPADSFRVVTPHGNQPFSRDALRAVQTPQAFRAEVLQQAFRLPYSPTFTDEATMVQQAGYADIALTQGSERNFKITRPIDLLIASQLIEHA